MQRFLFDVAANRRRIDLPLAGALARAASMAARLLGKVPGSFGDDPGIVGTMEPLRIDARVVVPADAMSWRAVRSGGPGGQNVNKVSSKVELRVALGALPLPPDAFERLRNLAKRYLTRDDELVITSDATRDQVRNLEDARTKLAELVRAALVRPKLRRPTKPTRGSVERRIDDKRRTASKKRDRRFDAD